MTFSINNPGKELKLEVSVVIYTGLVSYLKKSCGSQVR